MNENEKNDEVPFEQKLTKLAAATEVCDKCCKYPELYLKQYGDAETANLWLNERCRECPMNLLVSG